MTKSSNLLDQDVVRIAKKELKKIGQYGYVSKKLQAVIAASEYGIKDVARIYNISRNSITSWIKSIKKMDIESLKAPKTRKRKQIINDELMSIIKNWIIENPNIIAKQVQKKLIQEFMLDVSLSTAYRAIKRLNFSYITPRPRHYKKDEKLVSEFKKKSSEEN
jgi:transposase